MGNIRIDIKNPAATTRRIANAIQNRVIPVVAEQILTDSNTYVRMQDGTLANSAHTEAKGRRIVWSTRYAKKVYYTGIPRTNRNPLASLRWFEKAKRNHLGEWIAQANELTRRL